MSRWRIGLALATVLISLAACKSAEQRQAEQDQADEARCARMGVPVAPGDPQYIQCRMWAAQMRLEEEQQRRDAFMAALAAYGAMQQPPQAQPYDEPPAQPWIVPPPAPQNTWCRPVGRWMSCTSQ